jgi:4-hydroxythreonine-4-phosphate dehydrogenase
MDPRLPLALTRGDPSGIGPELALRAWCLTHADPTAPAFVLAAEPDHLAALARRLGLDVPIESVAPADTLAIFPKALPVLDSGARVLGEPGVPDPADASATLASIETCVSLVETGMASAVVTNPIAKEVLYSAGFPHPGHTEFLAELACRSRGKSMRPVMLLWSSELAIVPATIHVPLARVPSLLTRELLVETGRIVAADLVSRFTISAPRLAFCGLNPHAGEGGAIGREDIEIVAPAVEDLRSRGIDAKGPYPADTLFHAAARRKYDVAIAMYHDQALIPVKTLCFDRAVNVTLGLPFVRTSPDHGTAFDIAGKGLAEPTSLLAALRLAAELTASCPRS